MWWLYLVPNDQWNTRNITQHLAHAHRVWGWERILMLRHFYWFGLTSHSLRFISKFCLEKPPENRSFNIDIVCAAICMLHLPHAARTLRAVRVLLAVHSQISCILWMPRGIVLAYSNRDFLNPLVGEPGPEPEHGPRPQQKETWILLPPHADSWYV